MNSWQKASLVALGITSAFLTAPQVMATDCTLLPQTPYKSKESSTVYYITRNCTKRPFTNETAFFAYFSSWKQVKITTSIILKNIPDDAKGAMTYKLPGAPINPIVLPSTPVVTPPVVQPPAQPTTPVITVPVTPPTIPVTPITPTSPAVSTVMTDFLTCPSDSERAELDSAFNIVWGRDWENKPFDCNYTSTSASRLPIYATLRLIKKIEFTKPLPFTSGQNLYSYLTKTKLTLNPSQNCAEYSTGWNYVVNLGGTFAHVHAVKSGSAACEMASVGINERLNDFVYNPLYKLGTLVHEAHHAINGSLHTGVNGGDKSIDENSAWAAQFYFYAWMSEYTDIDPNTKSLAKNAARDILNSRFSENKCPSNTELKAVVNKIAGNICQ